MHLCVNKSYCPEPFYVEKKKWKMRNVRVATLCYFAASVSLLFFLFNRANRIGHQCTYFLSHICSLLAFSSKL